MDLLVDELLEPRLDPEIDLSILIPCYNEEENVFGAIEANVAAATELNLRYEIIVVDDCSEDDTVKKVEEFQRSYPNVPVQLVRNEKNKGLARTFVDTAFIAKGRYYRLCCGDNVEPRATLVKIFSHLGQADIVAPYQPVVVGRTLKRRILSSTYTFLINRLSGHSLKYYNGCQLFRRDFVMRWHSYSDGFGFQADMLTRMLDEGATVVQFPVSVNERQSGRSKALSMRNLFSTTHVLLEIFFRRLRNVFFDK